MSDFIELRDNVGVVFLNPKKLEHIRVSGGGSLISAGGSIIDVNESPQEIIAKIEEWKSKRTVYESCTNCGSGAIAKFLNTKGMYTCVCGYVSGYDNMQHVCMYRTKNEA